MRASLGTFVALSAAYSEGEPKVSIPFDRIRDIMRPDGALAALAAEAE